MGGTDQGATRDGDELIAVDAGLDPSVFDHGDWAPTNAWGVNSLPRLTSPEFRSSVTQCSSSPAACFIVLRLSGHVIPSVAERSILQLEIDSSSRTTPKPKRSPFHWTTEKQGSIAHKELLGRGGFGEVHRVTPSVIITDF